MSIRAKITIVHQGKVKTFRQCAHDSLDEFRSRALWQAGIPDGDAYFYFEEEGHPTPGPVGEHCLGMKMVRGMGRISGLFNLVNGLVYDYRDRELRAAL
jgi:hypothetical protein